MRAKELRADGSLTGVLVTRVESPITLPAQSVLGRTTIAGLAQMWVTFGVKHGLDPEELCAASGFSPSAISEPDRQVPHFWYASLRRNVIARLPQVAVGIELGQFSSLGQFGYFGLALQHCTTALEMLRLVTRIGRFMDSAAAEYGLRVEVSADRVELAVPRTAEDPPEAVEAIFIGNVRTLGQLIGVDFAPREVRFRHQPSGFVRDKLLELLRCPVEFGASEDSLVFERADMDRPLKMGSPESARHFEAQLGRMMEKSEQPFVTVVTRVIEAQLASGDFSQERIARGLHLSTRTLQRKLQEDGVKYSQLVDDVRKAMASRMVLDAKVPIYAVAFATGYGDVSSFNRVWKRWMGVSPSEYREAHAARRRAPESAEM